MGPTKALGHQCEQLERQKREGDDFIDSRVLDLFKSTRTMALDVIKKRWLQIKEEGGFQGLENGFRGEIARREWLLS